MKLDVKFSQENKNLNVNFGQVNVVSGNDAKDKIKSVYEAGYQQGKTDYGVEILTGTVTPASDVQNVRIALNKDKLPKFAEITAVENLPSGSVITDWFVNPNISISGDVYYGGGIYLSSGGNISHASTIASNTNASRLSKEYVVFGTGSASSSSQAKWRSGVTYQYKIIYYNE